MCRHLGHLGPATSLQALLRDPPHALERQAWLAREMARSTVNADGFGVGWWDLSVRPEPAVHRATVPIWADASFASWAGLVHTTAVVAALRSATPPSPLELSGNAPFAAGPWLFSLNGIVEGYREGVGALLRRQCSPVRESAIIGSTDGEVLFALVLTLLDEGRTPPEALVEVHERVQLQRGGRVNLLLGDGARLHATRGIDSLYVRATGLATTIASEATDDDPSWQAVPEQTLVTATASGVHLEPLTR
jgi:glutamine amidotransferase